MLVTKAIVAHIVKIARISSKTPTEIYEDLLKNPRLQNPAQAGDTYTLKPTIGSFFSLGFLFPRIKILNNGNNMRCQFMGRLEVELRAVMTMLGVGEPIRRPRVNGRGENYDVLTYAESSGAVLETLYGYGIQDLVQGETNFFLAANKPQHVWYFCKGMSTSARRVNAYNQFQLAFASTPQCEAGKTLLESLDVNVTVEQEGKYLYIEDSHELRQRFSELDSLGQLRSAYGP